jgi:DNA-directed RNA polymerase specialized sigma subunit
MPLIDKQIIRKVENQLRSYPQYLMSTAEQREALLHGTPTQDGERTCQTWKVSNPTMQRGVGLAELSEGWPGVITQALRQMPGELQQVIQCYYFKNMNYLQIADRLHVSKTLVYAWKDNAVMYIVLLATQRGLIRPIREGESA